MEDQARSVAYLDNHRIPLSSWFCEHLCASFRGEHLGWKPKNGRPGKVGSLSNIHCLPLRFQRRKCRAAPPMSSTLIGSSAGSAADAGWLL